MFPPRLDPKIERLNYALRQNITLEIGKVTCHCVCHQVGTRKAVAKKSAFFDCAKTHFKLKASPAIYATL